MKTRSPKLFRRNRKTSQRRRASRSRYFRPIAAEMLEDRRLLSTFGGVEIQPNALAAFTGFLPVGVDREDFLEGINLNATGSADGGGVFNLLSGDGAEGAGGFTSLPETEPNDGVAIATPVPLGFDNNEFERVIVVGNLTAGDLDVFRVELNAGDILSAKIDSIGPPITPPIAINSVGLLDSRGVVKMGSSQNVTFLHPSSSPLRAANLVGGTINGVNAALSWVIESPGTYYVQASSFISIAGEEYTLELEVYRPVLEQQADGAHQILFLDFNGAFIDTGIFTPGAVGGSAFLSPLSSFLPGWGLTPADESAVIDSIVANVQRAFDDVATNGNNPFFDIEIRNSRDHSDPFGLPNVSRVIVGGTIAELFIPTLGIAQSIDVGNFDTTETAVVLLDLLSSPLVANALNSLNFVPRTGSIIDVIGAGVGNITSHEAGHFFGGWHQDPLNAQSVLMDQGGVSLANIAGVGPDGVFGTADDIAVSFGPPDNFVPNEGFFGVEDVRNAVAFGLSTGAQPAPTPARVRGLKFLDRDGNGIRGANEPTLEGWTIFDDRNNNGQLDGLEPSTVTAADGTYELLLSSGNHTIREVQQFQWTQTFPGGNGAHNISLTSGQVLNNINFGNRAAPASISGVKFNDANGNGIQDLGELGLGGFHIYIDVNGDGRLGAGEPAAITQANGTYTIPNVDPDTVIVREAPRAGFIQTFPATGFHTVVLQAGLQVTGIDFGNQPAIDFGDAPESYGTLLANNGARHGILPGFHLGPSILDPNNPGFGVDREDDGQPTATADGDDTNGVDDEDGADFTAIQLVAGQTTLVPVTVTTTGISPGVLNMWVDLNGNGVFDHPTELVVDDLLLGEGVHQVPVTILNTGAPIGNTFLRMRYSLQRGIGPTGDGGAGEVEDHVVQVLADVPVANPDNFSVEQDFFEASLDVLANDVSSSAGGLVISAITVPPDQQGTVQIVGVAGNQTIEYTPRQGFVGIETFEYEVRDAGGATDTALVTIEVFPRFDEPRAVDDTRTNFPLAGDDIFVLANDIIGANGPITITGVGVDPINVGNTTILGPTNGTAQINGNAITYVPNGPGTDQFTYTISDSSLPIPVTSTAIVTVHTVNSNGDDEMRLRLEVTNLAGTQQLNQVSQGDEFLLRLHVLDLRGTTPVNERGVFAAFADILFNGTLATVNRATVTPANPTGIALIPGDEYQNFSPPLPDITVPGLIDEIGLFTSSFSPLGPQEELLISIRMTAVTPGVLDFVSDPADVLPFHNTLLFTRTGGLTPSQIEFTTTSVTINAGSPEGEFFNSNNRYDVNDDGFVAPDDVLDIINDLNANGARLLTSGGGEGESNNMPTPGKYVDVSNDGFVAANDALLVINHLLAVGSIGAPPEGEGEGELTVAALNEPILTSAVDTASSSLSLLMSAPAASMGPGAIEEDSTDAAADLANSLSVDAVLRDESFNSGPSHDGDDARELLAASNEGKAELESLLDELVDDVNGAWLD